MAGSSSVHECFVKLPHGIDLEALSLVGFQLRDDLVFVLLLDGPGRQHVAGTEQLGR